jgi:phage FluMu protein Com
MTTPSDIPPQAFAPVIIEADPVRCQACNRMLAELATAPWRIKCGRCGALNWATADGQLRCTEPTKVTKAIRAQDNGGASA